MSQQCILLHRPYHAVVVAVVVVVVSVNDRAPQTTEQRQNSCKLPIHTQCRMLDVKLRCGFMNEQQSSLVGIRLSHIELDRSVGLVVFSQYRTTNHSTG